MDPDLGPRRFARFMGDGESALARVGVRWCARFLKRSLVGVVGGEGKWRACRPTFDGQRVVERWSALASLPPVSLLLLVSFGLRGLRCYVSVRPAAAAMSCRCMLATPRACLCAQIPPAVERRRLS